MIDKLRVGGVVLTTCLMASWSMSVRSRLLRPWCTEETRTQVPPTLLSAELFPLRTRVHWLLWTQFAPLDLIEQINVSPSNFFVCVSGSGSESMVTDKLFEKQCTNVIYKVAPRIGWRILNRCHAVELKVFLDLSREQQESKIFNASLVEVEKTNAYLEWMHINAILNPN